jgi:hypothetical protein
MPRKTCLILAFGLVLLGGPVVSGEPRSVQAPAILLFPQANSRATYLDVHNVREAWEISRGAGVKVGVLDHSFGYRVHEDLYAGGKNFQDGEWGESFADVSHGQWSQGHLVEYRVR